MSNLTKILLTSFLTVFTGTSVYALGQIILRFFIKPIHRQTKIIADISEALIYYAREYTSPDLFKEDHLKKTYKKFRQLVSLLGTTTAMIKWYRFFEILKVVPKKSDVSKAQKELFSLADIILSGKRVDPIKINERANKIRKLLGIPEEE